jgi:hypothetical protein
MSTIADFIRSKNYVTDLEEFVVWNFKILKMNTKTFNLLITSVEESFLYTVTS